MTIIFCNHQFIEDTAPCIPITDRGFLFGDAVFTTIKVVDGAPQFFEEHIARLNEQCDVLHITPPKFHIKDVEQLILKNGANQGIFRLKIIITGGNTPHLNLSPRAFGKYLMMLAPITIEPIDACKLTIYPGLVYRPSARLKTLSYLDRLMLSEYAVSHGFHEALVLSAEGFITETQVSNIFWRVGQDIFMPDESLEFLAGITLNFWTDILKKEKYRIHHVKEKVENIPANAQIYICNAIKGVVPVVAIDDKIFHRDVKIEKEIFKNVK